MTPNQKNELLSALAIARAAIARSQSQVGVYTDIYDQAKWTAHHVEKLSEAVLRA